jgi:endonuclease YncB( thermonuclease family)
VSVPSKGYLLTLGLSGIRADAKVKFGGDADKENMLKSYPMQLKDGAPCFPNIAFHKARDALLQRDVEIEIEGIDVGGGFVGRLFYKPEVAEVVEEKPAPPAQGQKGKQPAQPQKGGKQAPAPAPVASGKDIIGKDALHDWGLKLLEEGHAALSPFADKVITDLPLKQAYSNAQRHAQDNKLNIWWNFNRAKYEAEQREKERELQGADEEEDEAPPVYERVQVTEIMTGSNFFYQLVNPATDHSLTELSAAFAGCNFEGLPEYTPEPPKDKKDPKEMIAGRFTVDGNWYRAEVIRFLPTKAENETPQFELRYIDYGNTEIVTAANIRKLPPEIASVGGGKGLAYKARLAHLTAPSLDEDYGRDAAAFFKELVWGKTMRANIRQSRRDKEVRQVSLGDDESGLVINGVLVKEGLARVDRSGPISKKAGKKTEYEVLKEAEAEAIQKHLNIWEYGELPDSGDERAFANILR